MRSGRYAGAPCHESAGYLLQVLVAVQKEAYDPGGSSLLTCPKAAPVEVGSGAGGNPTGAQSAPNCKESSACCGWVLPGSRQCRARAALQSAGA